MTLYGFGSNGSGQLGVGYTEDVNTPTPCIGLPDNDSIKKISGGGNHSAVITQTGRLFMTGYSQLGEGKTEKKEWTVYREIESCYRWDDVVCGWSFTLLLSKGRVYGIGTSRWYELNEEIEYEDIKELDPQLTDIIQISCGWRHGIALNKQGEVFGWGWGKHGQLGTQAASVKYKHTKYRHHVHKIEMSQPIAQIACGHVHTLMRGYDGRVSGMGSNKYNQLDCPDTLSTHIDAGWHHSVSIDTEGTLRMWGRNDHGQLMQLPDIVQISCGSEHTLAVKKNKDVIGWGWNEHGNCTGTVPSTVEPVIITVSESTLLGTGCATSWFTQKE
ncbi:regulator of chromosome condensation 1/beta-lactamase-inhibitor protein II [Pilobolus umbonatus]|nr:regulator of chromosome condensation 1/beta-lactamase-inhibitor protein II [Pilobolus umbonatus]